MGKGHYWTMRAGYTLGATGVIVPRPANDDKGDTTIGCDDKNLDVSCVANQDEHHDREVVGGRARRSSTRDRKTRATASARRIMATSEVSDYRWTQKNWLSVRVACQSAQLPAEPLIVIAQRALSVQSSGAVAIQTSRVRR